MKKAIRMRFTAGGRITIPKPIREKFEFLPGSEVEIIEEMGRVYLQKSVQASPRNSRLQSLRGLATVKMTTEEILTLTRSD